MRDRERDRERDRKVRKKKWKGEKKYSIEFK